MLKRDRVKDIFKTQYNTNVNYKHGRFKVYVSSLVSTLFRGRSFDIRRGGGGG